MKRKKPKTELIDCAEVLRTIDLSTSSFTMEFWIDEGHLHLSELKAVLNCNKAQVYSLNERIFRVECLLEQKQRQEKAEGAA